MIIQSVVRITCSVLMFTSSQPWQLWMVDAYNEHQKERHLAKAREAIAISRQDVGELGRTARAELASLRAARAPAAAAEPGPVGRSSAEPDTLLAWVPSPVTMMPVVSPQELNVPRRGQLALADPMPAARSPERSRRTRGAGVPTGTASREITVRRGALPSSGPALSRELSVLRRPPGGPSSVVSRELTALRRSGLVTGNVVSRELTVRRGSGTGLRHVASREFTLFRPAAAVCVPWQFDPVSNQEIPHSIISNKPTTLKAVVYTDTPTDQLTYSWDFGDGDTLTMVPVGNPRVIEAVHTYIGTQGQLITATVTVHDPVYGDLTDIYPMIVQNSDLPVEANIAIDEGLWYLHRQQLANGSWSASGNAAGYEAGVTASVLHAMQINGHVTTRSALQDPLVDDVRRGLNRLMTYLGTVTIGPQPQGDPDSNGNGIGIQVATDNRPIYEGGMVMDALSTSGTPDRVAATGPAGVAGRSYRDIVQDMIDMYAWGQDDSGDADDGGWRYSWNVDSDNSAAQWAAIGILGAKTALGLDAPGWVKEQNLLWLDFSQLADGRFGYTDTGFCCGWEATTPSGLIQLSMDGVSTFDARWLAAETYMADNWDAWLLSNEVYAWYAFAKAMRTSIPEPLTTITDGMGNEFEWYAGTPRQTGLARYIIDRQFPPDSVDPTQPPGTWPDDSPFPALGQVYNAAWQVVILTPTLFSQALFADAGQDIVWACDEPLLFDGCGSFHLDPSRELVQYEWDFDGDGTFDFIGSACNVGHTYSGSECPPEGESVTYTAVLRVTDDIGQAASDIRQVTIAPPPHAPVADVGGPYLACSGVTFTPDTAGSFDIDPGDYITLQQWDFDGSDGFDFDNPDLEVVCSVDGCPPVTHTFPGSGNFNVGLRVLDTGVFNPVGCTPGVDCVPQASEPDFAAVTVVDNTAPLADADGPYAVDECAGLQLDGSFSSDPDGHALTFAWDLDGDGEFDDASGAAPVVMLKSDPAGPQDPDCVELSVGLRVQDICEQADDQTLVTVCDLAPAAALSGPTALAVDQQGCFIATVTTPCDDIVAVEWDWQYLEPQGFMPSGDTGAQQCHSYDIQGPYVVAVRVTDADGDHIVSTFDVTVSPEEAFLQPFDLAIEVVYEHYTYLPDTNRFRADASLLNVGQSIIQGPVVLAFEDLTPPGTTLLGTVDETTGNILPPDGTLAGGASYVDFTSRLIDDLLDPAEQTAPLTILWQVSGSQELFSFVDTPYALNSVPFFTSVPVTSATEGVPYVYHARAEDVEGNPLVYGLAAGPPGMTIGAASGVVQWLPGQQDAGVHAVTLTADDGFSAGPALQSFDITVGAVNVKPQFLSTPETVTDLQQWCYDVVIEDPDGDPVALELLNGPAGMTLDGNLLCWNPVSAGSYYVKLSAYDYDPAEPALPIHVVVQDFSLVVVPCGNPPVIVSNAPAGAAEGQAYTYDVEATAPPGQPIEFSLAVAPEGMDIDPASGLINWTPTQQQAGNRVVKVVVALVANPLCRDEQIFQIDVQSVNVPPQINSTPPVVATEGSAYQYLVQAEDLDGDPITYRLTGAPQGMTIVPEVGLIEWLPGQTAAADHPGGAVVAVAACDPFDACAVQNFTIDITPVNVAPRFASEPVYSATEGQEYVYGVQVVDDDQDALTLMLEVTPDDPAAPPMLLDLQNVVRWTPSEVAGKSNPHAVRLVVDDGQLSASQTYEIFVISVNQPPVVGAIGPQSIDEGQQLSLQIVAADPDQDPLQFTRISAQPDGMNVHPSGGLIEWLAGCNDAGVYPVVIDVSDGNPGGTVQVAFDLTVNPVNCPPEITSVPPETAVLNELFSYQVQAADPEGLAVSCTLQDPPAGMTVQDCLITWTPDQLGDFMIQVTASDDVPRDCTQGGAWCQDFTLSVTPCANPPQIVSVPGNTAVVGAIYTYQTELADPQPDTPTYELGPGAPSGMTIDAAGLVIWTPTAGQAGFQNVTVGVYSGLSQCRDDQAFTIEVLECPTAPPQITSVPVTSATEGAAYQYDVDSNPAAGVTFELAESPAGMTIDPVSGIIDWQPLSGDVGTHTVRVYALSADCRAEQAFALTVAPFSYAPAITSICPTGAVAGQPFQYDVEAVDLNGDPVSFTLLQSLIDPPMPPAGMTIDSGSGVVSWTPTTAQVGTVPFCVRVTELSAEGLSSEQCCDVDVVTNSAPVFVSLPPPIAVADANYVYQAQASDADQDTLQYSLGTGAPASMFIDAGSGLLQWTPSAGDVGVQHDVTVMVSDGRGGMDVQSYQLTVFAAGTNAPPFITSVAPLTGTPDCPYAYTARAMDPNGDAMACALPDDFPAGMTMTPIDGESCLVAWTPAVADLGGQTVHVQFQETRTPELLAGDQVYVLNVQSNSPPVFDSAPPALVTVGATYRYDAEAADAEGDPLIFVLDSGPPGMAVNPASGVVTWTPTPADVDPVTGEAEYDIVLSADDGRCGVAQQSYRLYVISDTEPPVITLQAPLAIDPPEQTFPIQVSATDNVGVTALTLTVNGQPVAVSSDGTAFYTSSAAGLYTIVAIAADAAGNQAQETAYTLAVGAEPPPAPLLAILDPVDGSTISEAVDITGIVEQQDLAYWSLAYKPVGASDDNYVQIGFGTAEVLGPAGAVLGRMDATRLSNGLYTIRLRTLDHSGTLYEGVVSYLVDGKLKLGNFTVTYTDLEIAVDGLPITITRTYNSTNKSTGDFGVGWTLDVSSVEVQESATLNSGWDLIIAGFIFPIATLIPTKQHMVNVCWPNGRNQCFMLTAPATGFAMPFVNFTGFPMTIEPLTGTASLTSDQDGVGFLLVNGELSGAPLSGAFGQPFDPSAYTLTRADGMEFNFAGTGRIAKLQSMRDRNGNLLTFTRDGIIHSSGQSVLFQRDAQDRITAITDSAGNVLTYDYDARGDLVAYHDAGGHTSTFEYAGDHLLVDTFDPLGRRGVRNEYDDDGRLIAGTDANGNRVEFNRDLDARQEVRFDRLGNPTVQYFDERGNVILEADAEGTEREFEYDERDNLLRETVLTTPECPGQEKLFTYNDDDFVVSETSCTGGVIVYERNEFGQALTRTDPLGNVTQFEYDDLGNLTREIAADGGVTVHAYDGQGRKVSITDPLGHTEFFEYDGLGRRRAHVDFAGARTEFEYDAAGNRTLRRQFQTQESGLQILETGFAYDANNRVVGVTDPFGNAVLTQYTATGEKAATTDRLGNVTAYEYYLTGALKQVLHPDGTTEFYEYDAEGQRTAATDRNGNVTYFEYDKIGRVTARIWPDDTPQDLADNPRTETEFDCVGRVTVERDEKGNATQLGYPDCNTQVVTDALTNTTVHDFDMAGNRIRVTDALLRVTEFFYDPMNRLTRTRFDDLTESEVQYDQKGRKTAEIDQAGTLVRYEHDSMDRLAGVIQFDGAQEQSTRYEYDELGNVTRETDALGRSKQFFYETGRLVKRVLPLGQQETMQYDPLGRVTATVDFDGRQIDREFDNRGHLARETWSDGTIHEFEYRPTGERTLERITTAGPTVRETTKTYDPRGRLLSVGNPDGATLGYAYDAAGNRTSLTVTTAQSSQTTTQDFDVLNRLDQVMHPGGGTTVYAYDAVGNRHSVTLPNGVMTDYEYDTLNRLTRLLNSRTADGTVISEYSYTLGPAGNRLRVDETTPAGEARVVQYQYDDLYRLVAELIDEPAGSPQPDQAIAYSYDAAGNRLAKVASDVGGTRSTVYVYDANDRLIVEQETFESAGGGPPSTPAVTLYGYDASGNTVARSRGSLSDHYTYDARGRLLTAHIETEGFADVSFAYDADGLRVAKSVDGGPDTAFVVDKSQKHAQVVAEVSVEGGNPPEEVHYVYGDDLLTMTRPRSGTLYYAYDGQLSTRQLTDAAAQVTDTYTYDAFGRFLFGMLANTNLYRFSGEQYDPNLGFYYLRARYYMQSLGRFLTSDPANGSRWDPASLHKYLYAKANPLRYHDPSGLAAQEYKMLLCIVGLMLCAVAFLFCIIGILLLIVAVLIAVEALGELIENLVVPQGSGFIAGILFAAIVGFLFNLLQILSGADNKLEALLRSIRNIYPWCGRRVYVPCLIRVSAAFCSPPARIPRF